MPRNGNHPPQAKPAKPTAQERDPDYLILWADEMQELEKLVRHRLRRGWKLAGGVAVYGPYKFYQAVSRHAD